MNKKVIGIVAAVIIILGGGFLLINNNTNKSVKGGEITIKHALAEDGITVKKNPEKVVVFDYGMADSMDELGIKISGLPKGNLPSSLKKFESSEYTDIGTLFEPNFETIATMAPDLIIISGRQSDAYDELSKIAPTLYVEMYKGSYQQSFATNLNLLGEIFGKEKLAAEKIKDVEVRVKSLHEKLQASNQNGIMTLANNGELSAYGPDSRFGFIYKDFGLTPVDDNIEASTHGSSISYEYLFEKNPDYIFTLDRSKTIGKGKPNDEIFENDIMKQTNAYKNKNIVFVDGESWYLTTGGIKATDQILRDVEDAIK